MSDKPIPAPLLSSDRLNLSWRRHGVPIAVVGWIGIVAIGVAQMERYKLTPGRPAMAGAVAFPADHRLERATDTATLIMTVHPMCPCSRASAEELSQLMSHFDGRLKAYVLFADPPALGTNITETRPR